MRDILISILIPASMLLGLVSAPASILVLYWIGFQRPYDFSWGLWSTAPTFLIALIVCLVSLLIHGRFKLKFPPILILYLLLFSWITLSCVFAYSPDVAWNFYQIFIPPLIVTPIIVFAGINDLDLLKKVIWVATGSIGINAAKAGLSLGLSGGAHITRQINGFVGDNNVFGLVLCMVIAVLIGLRKTIPKKVWLQSVYYIALILIFATILFTKSRGAFLTMAIILILGAMFNGRPIRSFAVLGSMVLIGYFAIPHEYFDRLYTLQNVEEDGSAMGRVENWKMAFETAQQFPVFGAGLNNHQVFNVTQVSSETVRVAHSIYFQLLGEQGFVGLGIYLVILGYVFFCLFRTLMNAGQWVRMYPDLVWVKDLSFWMIIGLSGYTAGSGLLNMLVIEYPWHFMFFACLLGPLTEKEIRRRARRKRKAELKAGLERSAVAP